MGYHWGDFTAETANQKGELVLGIDPAWEDLPAAFKENAENPCDALRKYVDLVLATASAQIGFVKFQAAFFEAFGSKGLTVLAHGMRLARHAGIGVILDAKRGDIGSTARAYAHAYLTPDRDSDLEADCLTVNPFLGPDTLAPFFECADKYGKGLFVLAKTSNPGSSWLQDREIDGQPVSGHIAHLVNEEGRRTIGNSGLSNIGAVVGATYTSEGQALREIMPDAVLLAPGVGHQGGSVENVKSLRRSAGNGLLVPVSRGITKVDDLSVGQDAFATTISQRIEELKTLLQ